MIDVYYPYFDKEAVWQELKYSLRSLHTHFKDQFRVWIVGDLPKWILPGSVNHIQHKRCEGMSENTLYDAITKLLLFINHPDTGMNFLRMYDDIYFLADVDLVELGQFKAMYGHEEIPRRSGVWWDQLHKTIDVVLKKGYPGWNTETHLPELFDKERMRFVIDAYHALERRLLTSTLYYNTFYFNCHPKLFQDCNAIQFYNNENSRFYTSSSGNIQDKCEGKIYLNHNNAGLNDNLKKFIMKRFPVKSPFEK